MAAANPEAADTIYRAVLGDDTFTWAVDGEKRLRSRKKPYFAAQDLPNVPVFSDRMLELIGVIRKA